MVCGGYCIVLNVMVFNTLIIYALIASVASLVGYVLYIRDIRHGAVVPHPYTWIIWILTQSTAVLTLLYGGGLFGSVNLIVSILLMMLVLTIALRRGTYTIITTSDTIVLCGALGAFVGWFFVENPLWSLIVVTVIDASGYWPTYRKTYSAPRSEPIIFWILMSVSMFFTIMATAEYNVYTLPYTLTLLTGNVLLCGIIIWRRYTLTL